MFYLTDLEVETKDMAYFKIMFNSFDVDGDGVINRKELKIILQKMGFKGTSEQVRLGILNPYAAGD